MPQSMKVEKDQSLLNKDFELYVINLDRSQERWHRINAHLNDFGLISRRISAVDAKSLPLEVLHQHYDSKINQSDFFIALKPVEIACFLSHRKALDVFINNSEKLFAIILEDDVEFVTNPKVYQEQWVDILNVNSPVMLKLFRRRPISGKNVWKSARGKNQISYLDKVVHAKLVPLGTQGQVVNRAAAVKLLAAFDQFSMPVDVAYQHWWQHGVKVLVATPNQLNEISQIVGGTTIGGSQDMLFQLKVKRELRRFWFRFKLKIKSGWYYYRSSTKTELVLGEQVREQSEQLDSPVNTYVINLERSSARWQHIHKNLSGLGIAHQRVEAIDAQLHNLDKSGYDVISNKNEYFVPLKSTEIACYMSHIKALKQFLADPSIKYALIMEDDVELLETYAGIVALCNWLGSNDAGVVKLYSKRHFFGRKIAHFNKVDILLPWRIPLGFQAQLWNRLAAQEFVNKSESFYQAIDVEFQFNWRYDFSVYVIRQNKVREISTKLGGSTINQKQDTLSWVKLRLEIVRPWFRFKLLVKSIYHIGTQRRNG